MLLLGVVLVTTIAVQIATPFVAGRFIDRAVAGDPMRDLVLLAILTIALAVIGQGVSLAETWTAEYVSWEATNTLRTDLAAHILKLDASFHNEHTQGELIERVDGDVANLARFFSRFVVYVIGNCILIAGVLVLLCVVDWRVGLILGAFVLLALITMLRIRAIATPLWAKERQASADFYGFLGEYLGGLEDVRSNRAGAFVLRRCAELMRTWLAISVRAQMRGYGLVATSQGFFGLGIAFALAASAMLYRDDLLTLGTVYLIFRYTQMLREPTEQIRNEVQDLQQADASMGRIEALLSIAPRLVDGPGESLPPGPLALEFDDVSFGYVAGVPVLRDVSVKLEPGRVLGVVGRTGSGKTTLTRLLPRFHDPEAGAVRLGGVDLRDVRISAVRRRIGVVSQDVHLFHASLRDNLTLFDDTVPDGRIRDVLDDVGLTDWWRGLPDGFDTMIGSGASGLSAGQAQVLACARILLHDPDLVILDEASSRLDPATERLVHTALGRLLDGRTGIIVAHRLETLAYVDDILILEDGRVLEHGSRAELAADPNSRFSTLLRMTTMEVPA
jgi:ABC-type multidrug transport system fused ATPase/permease subunit